MIKALLIVILITVGLIAYSCCVSAGKADDESEEYWRKKYGER